MDLDMMAVIGKLDATCRQSLEEAAELCASNTHYNVEIEHFLYRLVDRSSTDVHVVMERYGTRPEAALKELAGALKRFRRGNSRTPALAPQLPRLLQEAWLYASIHLGGYAVRSGAVLQALLDDEALRGTLFESAPSLAAIPRDALRKELREIIRASDEEPAPRRRRASDQAPAPPGAGARDAKQPALDQYTIDLTARARSGALDPILGRDDEIRQIIDILTRRRQNNPILTGEAGVGKTAVVEGFAQRVARGEVPPSLRDVSVRALDLGLLSAGAGVKGEFESRLKAVIAEVQAAPAPIILFIDEAHTMIGAGGPAGQGDAANLLKPALARGELRTIAATTWAEYKRYFEKDPALARRFQGVKIDEPGEAAAIAMLRGVAAGLERHHEVRILDEAVRDAVRLSQRYIAGRQLPDKAISVLDTACARVATGLAGAPPEVEDAARAIESAEAELAILRREDATGRGQRARILELEAERDAARARREELVQRWEAERALVRRIHDIEHVLTSAEPRTPAPGERDELDRLRAELDRLQGEAPMVPTCVDGRAVAAVVASFTGIPVGKMLTDEVRAVLSLSERMAERIVGQDDAIETIARRIRTSRAGLDDPSKPVGVFLLVGPSGVGKTETAATLADLLYGGARNMVVINMSEYQEAHTVSSLKGAPPGYVGYGRGGVLTEAVRRNPYTVVLLDEVEKAHPDVIELFYQVFDKGTLEDGEGVLVDFRNTLILLTSNLGAELIGARRAGGARPDPRVLADELRTTLYSRFPPALVGRTVIVPYYPLGDEQIRAIAKLKLDQVTRRFRESHRAELRCDASAVAAIAARCTEVESGARNIDAILTHTLLPELSGHVLDRMSRGESIGAIRVTVGEGGMFAFEMAP
ncbi:type VI secretion system ATPase TssH [Sorangium sp. So ce1000]|uniref:type VI secretion system ATPase TssH n=1 Tax=Sorangium sp. So ce1000 TaxID=3133325 RepID=UPI003F623E79